METELLSKAIENIIENEAQKRGIVLTRLELDRASSATVYGLSDSLNDCVETAIDIVVEDRTK